MQRLAGSTQIASPAGGNSSLSLLHRYKNAAEQVNGHWEVWRQMVNGKTKLEGTINRFLAVHR
ncbi:Uncharacterized protein APZ42_032392 [Daphnia magna]|uniref:Uncharacterized protein n=1 Tax=Daphnia magna TaxID=35525 RepID=A0A164M1P0_9CRUS|nr:Uncharacterized protein APZ42_032392 [Daphnia magna]